MMILVATVDVIQANEMAWQEVLEAFEVKTDDEYSDFSP